jgi:hypothetical protein
MSINMRKNRGVWGKLRKGMGSYGDQRDYREMWPLLTVETDLNRDSKRTNERGLFWVGLLGLSCRYKRFLLF